MIITTGKIIGGPDGAEEVDKNTYRCLIEIPGSGKVNGIPTRVENEPKIGDEVLCFILEDPFANDAIYFPLKTLSEQDFVGIARQGFKLEFTDEGIFMTGQEGEGDKVKMSWKKDEISMEVGNSKFTAKENTLEIKGFSTSITMGGTVAPNPKGGPFCAIPNCLFSGAPHQGDKVTGN